MTVSYGDASGDTAVVGHWNADGKDTIGIVRAGHQWHLDGNLDNYADTYMEFPLNGGVPPWGTWGLCHG